jgi:hypothetical protein
MSTAQVKIALHYLSSIQPHPDVLTHESGEGMATVLLHLSTNQFYELNGTGTRIWQLLSDSTPVTEIERLLANEYAVEPESVCRSVNSFLSMLEQEQLIVERREAA